MSSVGYLAKISTTVKERQHIVVQVCHVRNSVPSPQVVVTLQGAPLFHPRVEQIARNPIATNIVPSSQTEMRGETPTRTNNHTITMK